MQGPVLFYREINCCSPYEFVDEHRERVPDRERETLELIDELAATIEAEAGL